MPIITINKCENCGTKHQWIFTAPKLKELRLIKKVTGMSGNAFMDASDDGDPDALAALIYILHKRTKIDVPFDDVDLDFDELEIEPTAEEKEQAKKDALKAKAKGEGKAPPPSTQSGPNAEAAET